jgi:predicted aspartyl protease
MSLNLIPAALLPLLASLPLAVGQDAGNQASEVDLVAIGMDRSARMTVPVRVLEKGPFNFLIDTGAQNTVLSRGLANELLLVPSARARLIGIAGSQDVDTVNIDQIDLGRRSYYNLLAPLLERGNIGADGILGLDSLQGQRVLIDFRAQAMTIGDAASLGGNRGFEIVITARRRSGQLIMTNAVIDGVKVDVVIDTGAETSIGNLPLQRALSRRHSNDTTTLYSVTGQQMQADMGLATSLVIDKVSLNNVLIAYADSPAFAALGLGTKPAMLLGMRDLRSFDRVAIDFASRKILFDAPKGVIDAPRPPIY